MPIASPKKVSESQYVASDGQVTLGEVRWQEKKIRKLNDNCLWSASGELALIQRVEEIIQKFPNFDQPLNNIRDILSDSIKQAVTIFWDYLS